MLSISANTLNSVEVANQEPGKISRQKITIQPQGGGSAFTISDGEEIRKTLAHKLVKEKTSLFSAGESPISKNMLTCPFADHARLRRPFEGTFKRKNVTKYAPMILEKLLNGFWAEFDAKKIGKTIIDSILEEIEPTNLSSEEIEESKEVIAQPARDLVGATIETIIQLLQNYPHEAEKIRLEWLSFLNTLPVEDKSITLEKFQVFILGGDLNALHYSPSKHVDAFIKETLRLYPPITQIRRFPIVKFDLGEITIGPEDAIILDIRKSQIECDLENPQEFNPSRFLGEPSLRTTLPRLLLNYSSGYKSCLGQHLANIEFLLFTGLYAIFSPLEEQSNSLPVYSQHGFIMPRKLTIESPLVEILRILPLEESRKILQLPDISSKEIEVLCYMRLSSQSKINEWRDFFKKGIKGVNPEEFNDVDVGVLATIFDPFRYHTRDVENLMNQGVPFTYIVNDLKELNYPHCPLYYNPYGFQNCLINILDSFKLKKNGSEIIETNEIPD